MGICQQILEQLKTAPDSQISDRIRHKCLNFTGGNKELLELFKEIYETKEPDTSKFIRALVNPQYTAEYIRLEDEAAENANEPPVEPDEDTAQ